MPVPALPRYVVNVCKGGGPHGTFNGWKSHKFQSVRSVIPLARFHVTLGAHASRGKCHAKGFSKKPNRHFQCLGHEGPPWEVVGMDGFMAKPVKRDALRLTLEQLEQLRSGGIPPEPQPGTAPSCTLSTALSRQLEVARTSALPAILVCAYHNLPCNLTDCMWNLMNLLVLLGVEVARGPVDSL